MPKQSVGSVLLSFYMLISRQNWFFGLTFNKITNKPINEPGHEKTCLMSYAHNKDADQAVHPRSLISAFVVRCLDSVMPLVSVTKLSSLVLASVAEQASLSLTWSETPEDTFSHDEAQIMQIKVYRKKSSIINYFSYSGIIEFCQEFSYKVRVSKRINI